MSIIERREIEFDAEAVLMAVVSSPQAASAFGLPGLVPNSVRFYPKDRELAVLYGASNAPRAVRLGAAALGALLVSYCIRSRLPMPRRAAKGIRVDLASITLTFELKMARAPRASAEKNQAPAAAAVSAFTWAEPDRAKR
jgi:hypothetical protein